MHFTQVSAKVSSTVCTLQLNSLLEQKKYYIDNVM